MKISHIISVVCLTSLVNADIHIPLTEQQANMRYDVASIQRINGGPLDFNMIVTEPKRSTVPITVPTNRTR